jgi:hypothetical protein
MRLLPGKYVHCIWGNPGLKRTWLGAIFKKFSVKTSFKLKINLIRNNLNFNSIPPNHQLASPNLWDCPFNKNICLKSKNDSQNTSVRHFQCAFEDNVSALHVFIKQIFRAEEKAPLTLPPPNSAEPVDGVALFVPWVSLRFCNEMKMKWKIFISDLHRAQKYSFIIIVMTKDECGLDGRWAPKSLRWF